MADKEQAPRTDKGPQIPIPSRKKWADRLNKMVKPVRHDGPQEIDDAARQETKYPEDETNEG